MILDVPHPGAGQQGPGQRPFRFVRRRHPGDPVALLEGVGRAQEPAVAVRIEAPGGAPEMAEEILPGPVQGWATASEGAWYIPEGLRATTFRNTFFWAGMSQAVAPAPRIGLMQS